MKILRLLSDNILFVITLLLLAFIPLYPKLPLIDIKNTWVYIRAEDFFVLSALLIWFVQMLRGKVTLKTPLTLSIFMFWIIGALVTMHAVIIIFPTISNVFTNVAFFSFLRRIEYMSLFFVAYSGMRDKKFLSYVIITIVVTLLLVIGYGFGQRYLGFNAYLTMNEEYAKGIPIKLSAQSRVPSTFGGHYDLAAYLVLIIPILVSLLFGFRNWISRIVLIGSIGLGFILLFMTVSRVSFLVLLVSILVIIFFNGKKLLLQKKALFIYSIAILIGIIVFLSSSFSKNLLARFGNTVHEVDILVDAKTGLDIGQVKKVSSQNFQDKIILAQEFGSRADLSGANQDSKNATASAIVPFLLVPPEVYEVVPPDTPTGENLPQGTGYINLELSPVKKRLSDFYFEKARFNPNQASSVVTRFTGDFLVKKASAYDLSFTTRFQGEWPRAIEAFKRNILFGSGYSSVSLAVDNDFLRMLGEVGLLGFTSFFAIFLLVGIYTRKILPDVESPLARSFVLGVGAGILGIILNAFLIDVFEASKIAYLLWLLIGVTVGLLHLYQTKQFSLYKEFKNSLISPLAIIAYIAIFCGVLFAPMINNFFIGDDFTWLRWAADCSVFGHSSCPSTFSKVIHYFTQSDGFFYRPGTKSYFLAMYSLFWLNQGAYHIVSLVLHGIVTVLIFLFAIRILKDKIFAAISAFLFLILSGHLENIFWIASTGHLFNELFVLLSLLFFIFWQERRNVVYLVISVLSLAVSLLFYELGVVVPLLILAYNFVNQDKFKIKDQIKKASYLVLFIPVIGYFIIRFLSQSHWLNGDYSYNLAKLPLNFVGNSLGYIFIDLFGPMALSPYENLRDITRSHSLYVILFALLLVGVGLIFFKISKMKRFFLFEKIEKGDKRIIIWSVLFFLITLLPFLGLGNITSRYSYLSSAGITLLCAFGLKKLYFYLLKNGKEVALTTIITILSIFSLFHVIQIQQVADNWTSAGERVRKFFISIDSLYEDYWSQEDIKFHFVNVPIKVGEAWVFPVGLDDSLWFVFRNPKIQVYKESSLTDTLNSVSNFRSEKIFEFDQDGTVSEVKRVQTTTGEEIIRRK